MTLDPVDSSAAPPEATSEATPDITPLTEPAGGIPPVTNTAAGLRSVVARFLGGEGPVAADCERASGWRYGQATYLVQLRRAGAGTVLIDPVACPHLGAIASAVGDVEWVLHAASQDLPGLAAHGIVPPSLFDTELAARLLGMERVGLAAVVADTLGLGLAKEHSAADWSTRPLPESWLRYAALDVEVLLEVREVLAARLEQAGKAEWARQEFAAVLAAPPPAPKPEPWRRTSGTHQLRDRRQLAVIRALWETRDQMARSRDLAPGRVLSDKSLIAAATALPRSVSQLVTVGEFGGKYQRRRASTWQRAITSALELPDDALPTIRGPQSDGPPQPRLWPDRDPAAAARLAAAREVIATLSAKTNVPAENLLQPDALRRVCWKPPLPLTADAIADALTSLRARPWQVGLVAEPLAAAWATLDA